MINNIRHSTQRLRLWLLAAAAVFLITTLLESGHSHAVVAQPDEHCILCQHSVALDKICALIIGVTPPLLIGVLSFVLFIHITPALTSPFTFIRGPPAKRQDC